LGFFAKFTKIFNINKTTDFFLAAIASKEFDPKGGSSPVTRFVLGMCVMTGALTFFDFL